MLKIFFYLRWAYFSFFPLFKLLVCITPYISTNLLHLNSSSLTPARLLQPGVVFGGRPIEDVRWILDQRQKQESPIVYGIKSNAVGYDGISLKFLKFVLHHMEPFLTHIFNFIFTFTIFTFAWKTTEVFSVHKISSECELKEADRQTHQFFFRRCRRLWRCLWRNKLWSF